MIAAAIVFALIVGALVSFMPKKYSSSVEFYVINTNTSYDYTTSTLLSASEYLINDYVKLIKSDAILEKVCKELKDTHGIDTTPRAIRGMISATSETGTSLFTIKVSHTDKEYACKVATAIEKVAPPAVTEIAKPQRLTYSTITSYITEVIKEINKQSENGNIDVSDKDIYDIVEQKELGLSTSLECFKSVNSPVVDTSADSPSVAKFALVAAIVAAFAVFAIFVIKGLFRTNVSTEEDLKNLVCRPVLGSVPHWESNKK
jgi:capsular polysaccharide biosynthesis protein